MKKDKDECLFCNSKECYIRATSSEDNGATYDEIACDDHMLELSKHAFATHPGLMMTMQSNGTLVKRGARIKTLNEILCGK